MKFFSGLLKRHNSTILSAHVIYLDIFIYYVWHLKRKARTTQTVLFFFKTKLVRIPYLQSQITVIMILKPFSLLMLLNKEVIVSRWKIEYFISNCGLIIYAFCFPLLLYIRAMSQTEQLAIILHLISILRASFTIPIENGHNNYTGGRSKILQWHDKNL